MTILSWLSVKANIGPTFRAQETAAELGTAPGGGTRPAVPQWQ